MTKLILILFLASSLFSNEDSLIPTLANDPSVLIEGRVNAITGDPLFFEEDLIIQGAEPIRLSHSYVSSTKHLRANWTSSFLASAKNEEHSDLAGAGFGEYVPVIGLSIKAVSVIATPAIEYGCVPGCIAAKGAAAYYGS